MSREVKSVLGYYTKENPTVTFDYFSKEKYEEYVKKGCIFINTADLEKLIGKPEIKYENQ